MGQTVELELSFLLALFPIAVVLGGLLVGTWFRMNPIQNKRDKMILDTLSAAEQRIGQLQSDVASLEGQVLRLREDLHWEREQNCQLRAAVAELRPVTIVSAETFD